jgi:hypothetical protein
MPKAAWIIALTGALIACSTDNSYRTQGWDLNGVALSLEQAKQEYEACQASGESGQARCDTQEALYERNLELYETIMKQRAP